MADTARFDLRQCPRGEKGNDALGASLSRSMLMSTVRVSKSGPSGRPVAELSVASNVTSAQLGGLIQKVVTNDRILKAAGLKVCGGCQVGLATHILDQGDIINVE